MIVNPSVPTLIVDRRAEVCLCRRYKLIGNYVMSSIIHVHIIIRHCYFRFPPFTTFSTRNEGNSSHQNPTNGNKRKGWALSRYSGIHLPTSYHVHLADRLGHSPVWPNGFVVASAAWVLAPDGGLDKGVANLADLGLGVSLA